MPIQLVSELRLLISQRWNRLEPTLFLYLAPILPDELLPRAFGIAILIQDPLLRSPVLSRLIARLQPEARETVLEDELVAVQERETTYLRSERLRTLAPYLSAPLLPKALEIAGTIEYEENRVKVLIELAALLPKKEKQRVLRKALEAAGTVRNSIKRINRADSILI